MRVKVARSRSISASASPGLNAGDDDAARAYLEEWLEEYSGGVGELANREVDVAIVELRSDPRVLVAAAEPAFHGVHNALGSACRPGAEADDVQVVRRGHDGRSSGLERGFSVEELAISFRAATSSLT
jgi:hypothetical protein